MKKSVFEALMASFRTRAFRVGSYSTAVTAMVLAIVVFINIIADALPDRWVRFDVTSNQLYSISEQTKNIAASLEQDVTIYWIVQAGNEDSTVQALLENYEGLSSHITVEKRDPDVYPTFLEQYALESAYNNSLVVVCGDRYRYVDYYEIYVYDYTYYYYDGSYTVEFDGESAITSAIDFVISEDIPKIYLLSGHGEASLSTSFTSAVEKENMELAELSLLTLEAVPEDADCVLIVGPQSDLSAAETQMLTEYFTAGGKLMLLTDPLVDTRLTNLEAMMSSLGVTAQDGIVIESDTDYYYAWGYPIDLVPDLVSHTITSPLSSNGYYVLLEIAQGFVIDDTLPEGISVSQLLVTSDSAYSKISGYYMTTYEKEDGDISGPFTLAAVVTHNESDGNIIWVGSSTLVDDTINSVVSGGNQDMFLNCLNWMCDAEGTSISIHAKSLNYEYLTMDASTATMLTVMVVGVIPLAYLVVGIVVALRRKYR